MTLINHAEQMRMISNKFRNELKEKHYKGILDAVLNSISELAKKGYQSALFNNDIFDHVTKQKEIREWFAEKLFSELNQMGFEVVRPDHYHFVVYW